MADHKLEVTDETTADSQLGGAPADQTPERETYTVTAENGLFKNGKTIKQGSTVELDPETAQRFIDAGDVEASK